MAKFKIDVNSYDSDTFPIALYKWIPNRWFGGKWPLRRFASCRLQAVRWWDEGGNVRRVCHGENQGFTDLLADAVIRDGIKMLIIDPWNELEHARRKDETETQYTARAIRALKGEG